MMFFFLYAFHLKNRRRRRIENWVRALAARLGCRGDFFAVEGRNLFSSMAMDWHMDARHRHRHFEIFSAHHRGKRCIRIRLNYSALESLGSLYFSIESRRIWHGISGILDSQMKKFGDRTLDKRLILRCSDTILPHRLRHFEEFRDSIGRASLRSVRGWRLAFADGTLDVALGYVRLDAGLADDVEAALELLCNTADILRFHAMAIF
ncbi:MAG: hypothetical protein LBI69_03840 [Puniceicoccales bacterium]|nr:hypothetical protein [Puniceicoccales bacterium]